MTTDALTDAELSALRSLLDRSAIEQCINQYFHALDSRRFDLLEEVFAPEVDLGRGHAPIPRATYIEHLRGVGAYRTSHHGPRNIHLTIDGDTAHGNTFAVDALLIDERAPGETAAPFPVHDANTQPALRYHGLRYLDDFERRPEGWRITHRTGPLVLWRHEVLGVQVNPDVDHLRSGRRPLDPRVPREDPSTADDLAEGDSSAEPR